MSWNQRNFHHQILYHLSVHRASKVRNKGPKDIMAVEEPNGEVRFSTHLPYPNNLSRFGHCSNLFNKSYHFRHYLQWVMR